MAIFNSYVKLPDGITREEGEKKWKLRTVSGDSASDLGPPPDQTRLNLHLVTSSFFLVVFPYFWTNKPYESSINKHHVGWSKYHEVIQQIPIRWQELLLDWQIVVRVQVFDFLTLNLRTTKTRRWTTRPRWKKDFSGCLKTWCIYIYMCVCVYQW